MSPTIDRDNPARPGRDHAALAAINLSKRYGRSNWALRNVTVEVPTGSICALVGPNGAGKTTLLRSWVGFERPTAGSAEVDQLDVSAHRAEVVRKLGYVGQGTPLYGDLTVRDHLALACHLRGDFDEAAAARRINDLGIRPSSPARELSGGERAQVALAIALGTRAPILLLDEPLAHLDPLARREFLQEVLRSVRQSGITVLLASHVVSDIEATCDRLIVLGHGQVLFADAVELARRHHRIRPSSERGSPAAEPVGQFVGDHGEELTLVREPANGAEPASLEAIVLGYLAGGRSLDRGVGARTP